jgi:hypothetical protein
MKTIEAFFLRAKHWQLFLLFVGAVGLGEMVATAIMTASISSTGSVGSAGFVWGAIMALGMLCFVGWFWALGTFLNSISQPSLRLKPSFFRFALIYPVLYIFLAAPFFLNPDTSMFAIILPLHFFAMFCLFYDLYFVSKHLVIAETGKGATFYDFAGPFFLIWFFPVGIWFVQPRINRFYAERNRAEVLAENAAKP